MSKEEKQKQMYELVELWQESGISQREFAEVNSIKLSTFTYWVKRYKDSIENQSPVKGFVELKTLGSSAEIMIRYLNGTELILPAQTSLKAIKELIGI